MGGNSYIDLYRSTRLRTYLLSTLVTISNSFTIERFRPRFGWVRRVDVRLVVRTGGAPNVRDESLVLATGGR